ncbi:hypothetical protein F4777DRAFT_128119 [Nemania sp. FL0916]|nr:hypothetical protein F4777DRAFT_128119 [Nemania sp. FL0916]
MDHTQTAQQHTIMETHRVASPKTGDRSLLTRSPLSNRANIDVDKAGTTTNWEHKDSSEGRPSTHDSVCDALWLSTSDVAKSPYQTPGRPVTPLRSIDIDIDLGSESPLSRLETPFLYGYGTELAPILEQRSIATLRTMGSRSTSDLSSILHDAPGAVDNGSSSINSKSRGKSKSHSKSDPLTTPRPRTLAPRPSFRANDAAGTSPHIASHPPAEEENDENSSSSYPQLKRLTYSRPTVHTIDVHTYPRKPVYPAPQRPTTPPSLRRIARPRSEGDAYMRVSLAGNRSMSSGRGGGGGGVAYAAPEFRAPRSGHGNLATHPFVSVSQTSLAAGTAETQVARGLRRDGRASTGYVEVGSSSAHRGGAQTNTASRPDNSVGAVGTCKKCRHLRGERWSLGSTLVGRGPGMRRGEDWCSRCAWRKVVRAWCCGE